MDAKPEAATPPAIDRRAYPRLSAEEPATLLLLQDGSTHRARLVEISRGGCRIALDKPISVTAKARVEVAFTLNGNTLRLTAVTEWDRHDGTVGLRFGEMSERRRDELVVLLAEIGAKLAAKTAKQEVDSLTGRNASESRVISAASGLQHSDPKSIIPNGIADNSDAAVATKKPSARERRVQKRLQIDQRASIFLINVHSTIPGTILDVSKQGCRIRTDAKFPVGIYRRVEVEFVLDGLPFRLSGVTQAMHDRCLVGIRFLDLSQRKQDQLAEMIEELDQMREAKSAVDTLPA